MSRLEAARAALERLEQEDPEARKYVVPDRDRYALHLAIQRMAQLEKVAELARAAELDLRGEDSHSLLLLRLGLTELDNHPDTREPTTNEETPR